MSWALDQRVGSTGPRMLLLMLANGVDHNGQRILAVQVMADECEATPREVRVWPMQLEALGVVTVEEVEADGFGRSIVRLNMDGS
ncbi:MAG: hypothetical protein ACR2PM_11775 [Hyphomicrobiales bacterium]